jgi:hypothetical protein
MSDSTSTDPIEPEVMQETGMTQDQIERWASLTSEEQLEFFEQEARKGGLEPVSWDEALQDATEAVPDVEVMKRKRALVDVPFIITNIKINQGQWGLFVTFTAITQTPIIQGSESNAVIVNDSSKGGLAGQVAELGKKHGADARILIKKGLRESIYYCDNDTKKVVSKVPIANTFQASTFYLNL